jgi:hypothetical protein
MRIDSVSACFPTHVAMKLRHGWGTLFPAGSCFPKCGS